MMDLYQFQEEDEYKLHLYSYDSIWEVLNSLSVKLNLLSFGDELKVLYKLVNTMTNNSSEWEQEEAVSQQEREELMTRETR